jgi:hypothetical protein
MAAKTNSLQKMWCHSQLKKTPAHKKTAGDKRSMRQKDNPAIDAAMGAAGRQAKIRRAKHQPLLILAYPKIGPSAVFSLDINDSKVRIHFNHTLNLYDWI